MCRELQHAYLHYYRTSTVSIFVFMRYRYLVMVRYGNAWGPGRSVDEGPVDQRSLNVVSPVLIIVFALYLSFAFREHDNQVVEARRLVLIGDDACSSLKEGEAEVAAAQTKVTALTCVLTDCQGAIQVTQLHSYSANNALSHHT